MSACLRKEDREECFGSANTSESLWMCYNTCQRVCGPIKAAKGERHSQTDLSRGGQGGRELIVLMQMYVYANESQELMNAVISECVPAGYEGC